MKYVEFELIFVLAISVVCIIVLFDDVRLFGYFKGIYEALELRDGGSDYLGKGVLKVCWLLFANGF